MSKLRNKIRSLIREEIDIRQGRNTPSPESLNGYKQRFVKDTFKNFAYELQNEYDIEFEDVTEQYLAIRGDFQLYSSRQDMYKEGSMFVFVVNGEEVKVEVKGGPLGATHSEMHWIVDETFSETENPSESVRIAGAMRTLI